MRHTLKTVFKRHLCHNFDICLLIENADRVGRVNGFFDFGGRFSWVLFIWLDVRFLDRVWLIFSFFLLSFYSFWLMKYSVGVVYSCTWWAWFCEVSNNSWAVNFVLTDKGILQWEKELCEYWHWAVGIGISSPAESLLEQLKH